MFLFLLHFAMFQPSIHVSVECSLDFSLLLADFLLVYFSFTFCDVAFCLDIFNS